MTIARAALQTLVVLLALLGLAPRARAETVALPVSARAGEVVVRAAAGLDDVAAEMARATTADLARIRDDLPGLPSPRTVELRLVDDVRALAGVAPDGRGVPAWAVGVAFPGTSIIAVAMRRDGAMLEPMRTLRHELAHLALDTALGDNAPRWLHEGFAYQHAPDWVPERADTLFGMAWLGSAIPIRELDARFPAEELPASRAYAESYDFVAFLARRGRWADADDDGDRWPFRRFLRALAAAPADGATTMPSAPDGPATIGTPTPVKRRSVDQAAIAAFGVDLDGLYREWQADLQSRLMYLPAGVFALLVWILTAMLLVLAWRRRRRQNRVRLDRWTQDEAAAEARARAWAMWAAEADANARLAQATADDARSHPADAPPYLN